LVPPVFCIVRRNQGKQCCKSDGLFHI
jgi:hypothetical protein